MFNPSRRRAPLLLLVSLPLYIVACPLDARAIDWASPKVKHLLEEAKPSEKMRNVMQERQWQAAATSPLPEVREKLAEEFNRRRSAAAFPALSILLQDKEERVREKALAAFEHYFFSEEFRLTGPSPNFRFVWWIRESTLDEKLEKLHATAAARSRDRVRRLLDRIRSLVEAAAFPLTYEVGQGRTRQSGGKVKVTGPDPKNPGVVILTVEDKTVRKVLRGELKAWTYSPDGKYLAVASAGGWVYFPIDAQGKDITFPDEPLPGQYNQVRGVRDGGIHLFSAETGEFLGYAGVGPVTHLGFSDDSRTVLYQVGERRKVVPRTSVPPIR